MSLQEAMRPVTGTLAKIAMANPVQVVEALVLQCESYSSQIEASLEGMKGLSPLGFDVLMYTMLQRLELSRP